MKKLYAPPVMGEEKRSISGGYIPLEQNQCQFKDRQVLFIQGSACIDGSCCGCSNWNYIQVAGYLLEPLATQGKNPAAILNIDTIDNQGEQKAIRQILAEKYPNSRIEFD